MAFQLTRLNVPNLTTDYSAETNAAGQLAQSIGNLIPNIQKRQLETQKQQILGQIGTGDMDYDKAGRALISMGDTQAGATLLTLGQKAKEQQREADWLKNNAGILGDVQPQGMGAPATGAQATAPRGQLPPEIKAIIDRNVPEADREYAYRMAEKESSFNPAAVSPTGAKGLFQFTGGTGRQYGLVDRAGDLRANPEANTQAFVRFTEDNRNTLRNALGRDPTYGELALAHQQGAGGAIALLTGRGEVNPNNLRVNNVDPSAPRSEAAKRVMAYYGYGDGQGAAPSQPAGRAPAQVAQAPSQGVAPIPGDDPIKLRQEAEAYAQTNPEAARQMRVRADAAERSRGVQTAQAGADVPTGAEAQFVIPGTGQVVTREIAADPQVQALNRSLLGAPEKFKAGIQKRLEQRVEDLKYQRGEEGRQADVELKRLQAEAERRKLAGQTPVAGYRYKPDGGLEAIPGGPADEKRPANEVESRRVAAERAGLKPGDPRYENYLLTGTPGKPDEGKISEGDKKAVQEADDSVMASRTAITALNEAKALSKQAMSGPTAGARAMLGNNLPDMLVPDFLASPKASEATTNLENTVTAQALAQMKAIFGAAPTEGERKILLDIQGSINQPDNVRQKIYDRAIKAAEARLEFNQKRAEQLRGGEYYKAPGARQGGGQLQQPQQPQAQPQQPQQPQGVPQGARQAPDGNFYVPDPNRPGKYLMVQP